MMLNMQVVGYVIICMLCKFMVICYASYMFVNIQVTCLLICELHVCKYASYMFINMQVHDDTLCKSIS